MTYADADFQWWDLEESDLDAHLYNIIAPIQLGKRDYENSWEVFTRENPGGAYAWQVSSRYRQLEDAIVALRVIQKLLASPRIPVPTRRGDINRDEWIRMSIDLFLFRFAGIRDHCLHLVNELFELGMKPFDVRMSKVLKAPQLLDTAVPDALRGVAAIAPDHREERNRRAHEGFQRNYVEDTEALFLKMHAMDEDSDGTFAKRYMVRRSNGEHKVYDLSETFEKAALKLDQEFIPRAEQIVAATKLLVAELAEPFVQRYRAKPTLENG
jgi:hypothetical protein